MSVRFVDNTSLAALAGAGPSGVGAFGAWVQPLAFTGTFAVFALINALHYVGIHPNQIFIYTSSEALGSALSLTTWYYVGLNWNETSGAQEAFLNGVSDVTQSDFAASGAPSLNFGTGTGAFYFDGAMRGARVWDSINLSGPQFTTESLSISPVHVANLFDEWDFENAATAADSLSGLNDLIVANLIDGPDDPPPYASKVGGIFAGVMP